jgi:dihydrofolate synthase/folylpolyglutamate synthase
VPDIAGEKLAVVKPGANLILGPVDDEVRALAVATGARLVEPEPFQSVLPGYQATNFAVAVAAARAQLGALDPARVAEVANRIRVPGRMQVVCERPLTIYDGAHNPSGVEALAATLPAMVGDRPLIAVVSVLDDKDAAGMLRALVGQTAGAVFTSSRNPRALPPATLASLAEQLGGPPSEIVRDPRAAVARAQEMAGPDGAVLATGSIYLVADLLSDPARRRASAL